MQRIGRRGKSCVPRPRSLPALTTRGVYTQDQATLGAEISIPTGHYYLVVATRPGVGDGPTGH